MRFLRCVHAEFLLVAPRLTRTRLGVALLTLGIALVWLTTRGLDPLTAALLAGALGAITVVAASASSERDHAALTTALTHPTTPLAVATGRWLAMIVPATALVIGCTVAIGWRTGTVLASVVAAAAVGGCALAVAVPLGTSGVLTLFILMAVAGAIAPEHLVDLARPGVVRWAAASALELGPALWHYRDIATGDVGALLHAVAWTGLGILLASGFVARRR
ncbi:MAG TPA: hypothetical protein VGQ48_07945 [Gemmatimonadales bacterium]|jgi:hypothetical protein|nr:hypothetical protein [Gemmatimonadales bacterium]